MPVNLDNVSNRANIRAVQSILVEPSKSSGGSSGGAGSSVVTKYTITAEAGQGGSITPNGKTSVQKNSSQVFSVKPDDGYIIEDVIVDNESIGNQGSYTFKNVTANHTIKATFTKVKAPTIPDASKFTDISTHWAKDSIAFVVSKNLFAGTSDTTFSPDATMTRGMLVTVLHRFADKPAAGNATFSDIPSDAYYADAVLWAASNGIVNGVGNGKFEPNSDITREQIAAILYAYAGKPTTKNASILNQFEDASQISNWARPAMQWAIEKNIFSGKSEKILDPQSSATRAEVASILTRYLAMQ